MTHQSETTTAPPVLQNHFFRYDLRQELPGRELQEFSSTDMNDGEEAMLDRYGFKPLPGPVTEPLHYYTSGIAQAKFMAIAHVAPYRLIVFIMDEQALLAFRRKYDFAGTMLPQMLMPPQAEPPNNHEMIRMNTRALR